MKLIFGDILVDIIFGRRREKLREWIIPGEASDEVSNRVSIGMKFGISIVRRGGNLTMCLP